MVNKTKTLAFTLIELLVVLAIIAMLLTIALPRYHRSIDMSKQTILAENLRTMREVIDKFQADTGRFPNSLEELVQRKYLRDIPVDPITESTGTWLIITPEEKNKGMVANIKSGAQGYNHQGIAYGEL